MISSLNWRYSTQLFDKEKKISEEQLQTILESARLSPSAFGIQPWRFIVVTNPETRSKLREVGYNQPKITDSSHLVVIAVPKTLEEKDVDEYIQLVAVTRGISVESLSGYSDMIKGSLKWKTPEQRIEWFTRQAYIALGIIVAAASTERIDSGPMEGFDPKKFDEILGLEELGLESKVIVSLGFRSDTDKMSQAPKVRYPKEKVIIYRS